MPAATSKTSAPRSKSGVARPLRTKAVSPRQPRYRAPPLTEIAEYWQLLGKIKYLPTEGVAKVKAACAFAHQAHIHQLRDSGEAYITHPLAVAAQIADWRMDSDALLASLLHDVMEDAKIAKSELQQHFGIDVAEIVDGLSKLDKIEYSSVLEKQAVNFRKMLMAIARDLRVIMIKLADRQHNISTIHGLPSNKRARIAKETLEIYAPIALRLGLHETYSNLQQLAFAALYPLRARILAKHVAEARGSNLLLTDKIEEAIKKQLKERQLDARVISREKSLYSIYRKMRDKKLRLSEIMDLFGFRVIVSDEAACYLALGALHQLYKPMPGKFKDYIAIPRANGYKSLHNILMCPAGKLMGPKGKRIEIQIRSEEMDFVAQNGLASHWLYKDKSDGNDLHLQTHRWLKSLLELQESNAIDFFENVKIDLFPDEVYVFTPKGDIFALPRGATVIDFAYLVHTNVGHATTGAKVNQERVGLHRPLKSGDIVEIITHQPLQPNPSPAWLTFARTAKAKSRIRHYLRTQHQDAATALGERLLEQQFSTLGSSLPQVNSSDWQYAERVTGVTSAQLLIDIGIGKRLAAVVARLLLDHSEQRQHHDSPTPPNNGDISTTTTAANLKPLFITGGEGAAVTLASCCSPIPGDPICGIVKSGYGLLVHSLDCESLASASPREDKHARVLLEWQPQVDHYFPVRIRMEVFNVRGMLGTIANLASGAGANIEEVHTQASSTPGNTQLRLTLAVQSRNHLAQIFRQLRPLSGVVRLYRARNHPS